MELSVYGGDAFAVDNNGRTPLQCAQGDCIQILQTLTNNNVDLHMNSQQIKPISISPQHNTIPRQRPPASSPGPPYDKLPSTVI
ncbi:unnamed protein product [Rotaria magnacalcarata]|uniref:Uncharacterized protein n=1 Tax=Rotaria magnacalcarata TaxID=392030 RepID=A0A8S2J2J1_9BILA|nr:unnamed protein product [Rotaria magnacalcarata]